VTTALRTAGAGSARPTDRTERPLLSVVVPAYNEAAVIQKNLQRLCDSLAGLEAEYRWELVIVNDGSRDETGRVVETFARGRDNVVVLHHPANLGVGQALRSGFAHCRGDYVVTLDVDLSYSPEHIPLLLSRLRSTGAKVVVASPYMRGGRLTAVPWLRRVLSVCANRFLSFAARGHLSTLTGMVRAYDGPFLRTLDLKAQGMEINPEVIYKAMLLGATVDEIPAHLDWADQNPDRLAGRGQLNAKVLRHLLSVLLSGFLFRPVLFFIVPGLLVLAFSAIANTWVLIHVLEQYGRLAQYPTIATRASASVAAAFTQAPHTFIVGGISVIVSVQLISLGIIALQSRSYFEEMFHLGTSIYRSVGGLAARPQPSIARRSPSDG
jgi:glycosyltransferase involved in cell wall biosynthesis